MLYDSVCNRSDVVSLFYTCTHFHDVIVKSQKPVLVYILCFVFEMPCQVQTACREIAMSDQVTKKLLDFMYISASSISFHVMLESQVSLGAEVVFLAPITSI